MSNEQSTSPIGDPQEITQLAEVWADMRIKALEEETGEEIEDADGELHATWTDEALEWINAQIRRAKAEALQEFADAHRFPSEWVMFRRGDGSGVTVGDLLRETAEAIENGEAT